MILPQIITDINFLTKPCLDINTIAKPIDLMRLLEDTVRNIPYAAGLAAPQIGYHIKAFVVADGPDVKWFANTVVIPRFLNEPIIEVVEGCLSIPGEEFQVQRYGSIIVDDYFQGKFTCDGFYSQVIQHEYDHTRGITLLQSGIQIT